MPTMPTDRRAASATMTVARNRPAAKSPYNTNPRLSNRTKGGGGSIVVKLIFIALVGVAGYFGWKQFAAYKARPKPVVPPPVKQTVVVEEPPPAAVKPEKKAQRPKRKRRLTEAERDEELIRQAEEEERRKKALENDPAEIARRQILLREYR